MNKFTLVASAAVLTLGLSAFAETTTTAPAANTAPAATSSAPEATAATPAKAVPGKMMAKKHHKKGKKGSKEEPVVK